MVGFQGQLPSIVGALGLGLGTWGASLTRISRRIIGASVRWCAFVYLCWILSSSCLCRLRTRGHETPWNLTCGGGKIAFYLSIKVSLHFVEICHQAGGPVTSPLENTAFCRTLGLHQIHCQDLNGSGMAPCSQKPTGPAGCLSNHLIFYKV